MGRVPDVKRVVTKEFKRAGDRLAIIGGSDAGALGGSVYADFQGQRGDRLFDGGGAPAFCALWDALLAWHRSDGYLSGSAIAEGGVLLRLFEGSLGSGFGVRIDLSATQGRKQGGAGSQYLAELVFGEFIGSALIEVQRGAPLERFGLPYREIGEVTAQPELEIKTRTGEIVRETISNLEASWSLTFREVVG
jgi:phosphoribosylformylglycinamidine (FGAM) synthase-like enzyme